MKEDPMTKCPRCSSTDVVGFTLAPRGEPLEFTHCRNCEHRWWAEPQENTTLGLTDVLQRIGTAA
jgi:transcription elongation factor Elf1